MTKVKQLLVPWFYYRGRPREGEAGKLEAEGLARGRKRSRWMRNPVVAALLLCAAITSRANPDERKGPPPPPFETLASFAAAVNTPTGNNPVGSLVQGIDGNFYSELGWRRPRSGHHLQRYSRWSGHHPEIRRAHV